MDPSPIPKFDNPKLEMAAIQLFGAGRDNVSMLCRPILKSLAWTSRISRLRPQKPTTLATCAALMRLTWMN